jgi:hypothetical protein
MKCSKYEILGVLLIVFSNETIFLMIQNCQEKLPNLMTIYIYIYILARIRTYSM